MQKWVSYSGYADFRVLPAPRATKHYDINPNTVVDVLGETFTDSVTQETWERVKHNGREGWIRSAYIEPYKRNLLYGLVDFGGLQTPTLDDFQQYCDVFGVRQTNLCGPISVAMSLGISLPHVIERWRTADLSFFQRVWNWNTSKRSNGTGDGELARLYDLFDVKTVTLVNKYKRWTPQLAHDLTGAIVSVRISGSTGRIRGSDGILHWVVLMSSFLERCAGGYVTYYNPASDSEELSSYAEFAASARVPYGVLPLLRQESKVIG